MRPQPSICSGSSSGELPCIGTRQPARLLRTKCRPVLMTPAGRMLNQAPKMDKQTTVSTHDVTTAVAHYIQRPGKHTASPGNIPENQTEHQSPTEDTNAQKHLV